MSCINPNSKEFQDILKYEPNFLLAELEYNKLYPNEVDIDTNINTEINQLKEEPYVPNPNNNYLSNELVVDELNIDWEYDITNERNSYIPNDLLYDLMNNPANMIMTQENKDKFKVLESIVGKKEAFRDYMEQGQVVRPPYIVMNKISERLQQEEIVDEVKPFIIEDNIVEGDMEIDFTLINEAINQENNNKALEAISKLSEQLNIPYEIVSIEEAQKQFPNKPIAKGYFYGGKVYLVDGLFNQNTVFHEFSHAIIKSLSKDNPKLFVQLYNSLKDTSFGQDIIKKITSEYPELDVDSFPFMEEAIVTSLEFANIENANDQKSFFGKLYLAIKQFLRKIFGKKINISKLNPTTTLSELLDMINQGQEFILNNEFLDTDYLVMLQKIYQDEVAELFKIEKNISQTILNELFISVKDKVSAFKNNEGVYTKISDELANNLNDGLLQQMLKLLNESVTIGTKPVTDLINLSKDEEIEDRLRAYIKALVLADKVVDVYEKKINQLKASGVKTDDQFDALYAISNYVDSWLTKFNPTLQNTYQNTIYTSPVSYSVLFKDAPKTQELITKVYTKLEEISTSINELRFNSIVDLLEEHLINSVEPERVRSLNRLNELKKANLVTEYNREFTKYYGISPAEKMELDSLIQLSKTRRLTIEENNRKLDLETFSYAGLNVSKEQIRAIAKNEVGDSGWLNGMISSYDANQDIVAGGFMTYIKQFFNEIDGNINSKLTKLYSNLDTLLDKAGEGNYIGDTGGLGDRIRQVNKSHKKDDNGEIVPFYENQFISNFKDFQFDHQILKTKVKALLNKFNNENTEANKKEYEDAVDELETFENDYMNRDFVPEVYNLEKKYFNLTPAEEVRLNDLTNKGISNLIVDLQNNINEVLEFDKLTAKKIAKEKQEKIFKKIRAKEDYLVTSVDDFSSAEEIIELWKEYQELAYLYDDAGQNKTGVDLELAKLFSEFRKESAEYYEWIQRPELFNYEFEKFQQKTLLKYPLNSPEYDATINKWILLNTSVSITDEYWDDRVELIEERKQILDKLLQNNIQIGDVGPLYKKIYGILKKTKDTSGIFDGNSLNILEQEELKTLHEEIEEIKLDYIQLSGISKRDAQRYKDIYDYYNYYNTIKDSDKQFYKDTTEALRDKLIYYGISDAEIQRVKDIDKQLGDLTDTSSTKYYLSTFQNLIEGNQDTKDVFHEYVLNQFGIDLTTDILPEDKLEKILEETYFVDKLLGLGNTIFERWFINNHYKRDKLVEDGSNGWVEITVYAKTAAWQYSIPADKTKYYNSFSANTVNYRGPIEINGIPRVPNNTFSVRQRKDKYRTQPVIRDYVDANGNLVLANIDNRGRWLPKTIAEGAKDDKYINKDYIDMFNNKRDLFNLMLYLKNFYLDQQEGLPVPQKMYLSYPRQLSKGYDKRKRSFLMGIKKPLNWISSKWTRMLDSFKTSVIDDFNTDSVKDYQQSSAYVNITRPISGTYYFEVDECSLDIIGLIQDNLRSIEQYKVFGKKNSFARMFQKQIRELSSHPEIGAIKKMLNWAKVWTPTKDKNKPLTNTSNRRNDIENFIEKHFDGKNLKTTLPHAVKFEKGATRVVSFLSKVQAYSSFAFEYIKSLTNFFQGQSSMFKKSFGLTAYTTKDWAFVYPLVLKLQLKLIKSSRSKTQTDPDIQLLLILDAIPGFLNKNLFDFKNANLSKDLSISKIAYADRSFLNDQIEIHQMLAILNFNKFKLNGENVTLLDAVESVNGRIQTKAGTPKEYSITYDANDNIVLGKKINYIKNVHQNLLQKNVGVSGEMNQAEMYRSFIGKFLFSMLKFMPGMGSDRYQFVYNSRTKQVMGRINWSTGQRELGTYISILALIGQTFRVKGNLKYVQKEHLVKTLEFALAILIQYLIRLGYSNITFNDHDDDKDKPIEDQPNVNEVEVTYDENTEKIYKTLTKTTGLPNVPFVDPKYTITKSNEFEMNDWLRLHLLNLSLRVEAEEKTFLPWNPELYRTSSKLVFGSSVLEDRNVVFDMGKLLYYSHGALTGDEAAFYDQEAGPLIWQQSGSWKGFNVIGKTFGISGSLLSPGDAITNRFSPSAKKI